MAFNIDETAEEWGNAAAERRVITPLVSWLVDAVIGISSALLFVWLASVVSKPGEQPSIQAQIAIAILSGFVGASLGHLAVRYALRVFYRLKAPIVQRDDARAEIRRLRALPTVELTEMGWPRERDGVLLIPVQVANKDEVRAVDLDIYCWVRPFDGMKTMLDVENDQVAGVEDVFTSAQRAQGHLTIPLRVEPNSRRAGYLAYRLRGVKADTWSTIDLEPTDGVRNIQLGEKEVWPSLWPEILLKDNERRDFVDLE